MHFPVLVLEKKEFIHFYESLQNGRPLFAKLVFQFQIRSKAIVAQEAYLIAYAMDVYGRIMNSDAIKLYHKDDSGEKKIELPVNLGNLDLTRDELIPFIGPPDKVNNFEYLKLEPNATGKHYIGYEATVYGLNTMNVRLPINPCPPYCPSPPVPPNSPENAES